MAHIKMTILLVSVTVCMAVGNIKAAVEVAAMPPLDCAAVLCLRPICNDGEVSQTPPGQCCPICTGASQCFYKGNVYKDGENFKDDCNMCFCSNGNVGCTLMACPRKGCFYNGQYYKAGNSFKDDRNTCTCDRGRVACTEMACMTNKPGCFYKGKFYKDGASFKDDCNTCSCRGGSVACTEIGCVNKPGRCPKPTGFGICVERCAGDWSCKGDQKCCSNGCGHVCMNPVDTSSGCYRNGKYYNDGERVPGKNDCQKCVCRNGSIECDWLMCPAVYCEGQYNVPGQCCPVCPRNPIDGY